MRRKAKFIRAIFSLVIGILLLLSLTLPAIAGANVTGSFSVPLVISDVSASNIGYYNATISWKTNDDATSQVFYDTVYHEAIADYAYQTDNDTSPVSEHGITLTGLASMTIYHYRVRSTVPETGLIAVSDDYTFTTLDILEVETANGEEKDVDGVAVITVSIASVKDPVTLETVLGVPIADYSASLTFNPNFMEILEIRGGDLPFDTIPPDKVIIDNVAGTASVSDDISPAGTLPPIIIFRIVARLDDSCMVSDNLAVTIVEASDPGGMVMSAQDQPMIMTFQRGDVQRPVNGDVDIVDAMFGSQYIVGLRTLETTRQLNMASVKQDGSTGDIPNIIDCLFIAQYVVGIRNEYFELVP